MDVLSNAITAGVAAVTAAAVVDPSADNTPYLLCLVGVLAGTFGRVGYWFDRREGFKKFTALADVTSIPLLYVFAIGTAAYFSLSPPVAAATSGIGALIGIEPLRRVALAFIRTQAGIQRSAEPAMKDEANDTA